MEQRTGSAVRPLKKNFIINALYSGVAVLFSVLTFPYVARVLLPSDIGRISFATSVVSYFLLIAQLGIPLYGIKACAGVRDDKICLSRTVHEIFFINIVMSLIAYALFVAALIFIPRIRQETELLLIISSTVVLNSFGMEWLFQGLEEYNWIAVRSLSLRLITLILIFVLIKEQADYAIYAVSTVFTVAVSDILNFFRARRLIIFRYLGGYNFKRHIKPILIIFAMSCTITIYSNMDIVMLGFMKTNAEVGCYHAALKVKNALMSIVGPLTNVLLPRMSYYAKNSLAQELQSLCRKAVHFMILAALPLSLYCIVFARETLVMLLGQTYEAAAAPMRVLMPILLIGGISIITGLQFLIPIGKEKVVCYSTIFGAAADLVANFLLIPSLSCVGAAIGTLLAECVVLLFQVVTIRRMGISLLEGTNIKLISAAAFAAVISSIWIKYLEIPLPLLILISALLFFGIYLSVLMVFREPLVFETVESAMKNLRGRKGCG